MSDTVTNPNKEMSSLLPWNAFPVDLGWRNFIYASRLALVGILALVISYWLELEQPRWAVVTAYLITPAVAGAALAKGAFRFLGTLIAAVFALLFIALFSQNPILLVGAATLWMFGCYYGATKAQNFASYSFLLAGFTGLMITFEGAANPDGAWLIAVTRVTEISIGIACATLGCILVFPVYAVDELRNTLARTFSGLADYAAGALRPSTSAEDFMDLRRALLEQVTKFDALRSYTVFEARGMHAFDLPLREAVRELLSVLAVSRGLYFRLSNFREQGAEDVLSRLEPVLRNTIAILEQISVDPAVFDNASALRSRITSARRELTALAVEFETMTDRAPFADLANATLILRRTAIMLRSLTLVLIAEKAAFNPAVTRTPRPAITAARALSRQREALMQGARAALGVLLFCLFWYATEWDMGAAGIIGVTIMSYQYVNNDNPFVVGWPYFVATAAGALLAYFAIAYVYPWFDSFTMMAAFLFLVLLPVGLFIGTPRFSMRADLFIVQFLAVGITANVFQPNPLTFINENLAILLGMFSCLIVACLIPVTSRGARRSAYRQTMGELLPAAALGTRPGRHISHEISDLLASLLPRLKPGQGTDETLLRGMLSNASSALELGRLRHISTNPALPEKARLAIADGLDQLAAHLKALPERGEARDKALIEAKSTMEAIWTVLTQLDIPPGTESARTVLAAAASLRFLIDRLDLDRAFLDLSFTR